MRSWRSRSAIQGRRLGRRYEFESDQKTNDVKRCAHEEVNIHRGEGLVHAKV